MKEDGNFTELLKEVNNAGCFISLTIYAYIIVFRRHTILKLLHKLDDEEYHTNKEYIPVKIYIEKLSRLYFYPIRIGLLFWFLNRVAWNMTCLSEKSKGENREITCANSFSNWMPSFIDSPVLDWGVLALSLYAVYYMPFVITVSSIHIGCTYVSVARLQRLIRKLGDIDFRGEDVKITRRQLLDCIDFYNETNVITNLVSSYVKEKLHPILSYSVMGMVAVLTHQIIVNFDCILFLELWVWIISNSLISFHAQDLENMSEKLNIFIYSLPWYRMHPILIKDFELFFARTQKPFRLSVPMNININMSYMQKFMKFTYTAFMYLSRMKQE